MEIKAASTAYFHRLIADVELKKAMVELYNRSFTADELEEMLTFYATPTGRKALAQMSIIAVTFWMSSETKAPGY